MPTVAEAAAAGTPLSAALGAGLNTLSRSQDVCFRQYTKWTNPVDGYVSWIATGQLLTVSGSLHWAVDRNQSEDETLGVNRMIFTAEAPVTEFNVVSPNILWVSAIGIPEKNPPSEMRFAFSSRSSFFFQARLWHYRGDAVYPALASQLVDNVGQIPAGAVVSNSLPIWLSQNAMAPVYASFLVPDNIVPPYIVAHVVPDQTSALQAFPLYQGWPSPIPTPIPTQLYELTSQQLCHDRVRLTLYGFTNQMAIQYLAALIDYSINTDAFGFMNSPVPIDDKRTQREMAVIAMKKRIDIDASYYQRAADAIAKRLIAASLVNVTTEAA